MANDVIPRDKNRVPATGLVDTISGLTQGWSGILAGAVEAGAVAIVDASGNQITSFGGGTQYTDAAAAPANPVGPTLEWNEGGTWRTVSAAKPLPVTATVTSTTITGTVAVTQSTSPWVVSNTVLSVVGGGTEATAQRVTLASDSTGVLTVKQATASNLNATVVGTGTFVVQATLAAETTKVIGTVNQGTSPWVINTASATGAAVPANAFMIGISDGTNLVAVRQASNGLNTTAGGLIAVNNAAQFDDVSPTSITENSFGNLRISANRNLYNTIRDAAGNERGLNISAGGNISVDTVTTLTGTTTLTPGTGATNLGKAEDAAHASGDVGVMALGVANEALTNISGTDADYTPIGTDRNGTVHVAQKASTGTLSNVASSATSVTLLAANAARIGAQITNDSSALLYIKYGTTASTTSYTVVLAGAASAPFSYFEVPAGYTGRIDGIWASATGNARVTEETP